MLFGFIAQIIFNFVKKRAKKHVTLIYFICTGVCWSLFGILAGGAMFAYNSVFEPVSVTAVIKFMTITPGLMFVMGEMYALVCWLIWLRKEEL